VIWLCSEGNATDTREQEARFAMQELAQARSLETRPLIQALRFMQREDDRRLRRALS
jgi:hypothetical protein